MAWNCEDKKWRYFLSRNTKCLRCLCFLLLSCWTYSLPPFTTSRSTHWTSLPMNISQCQFRFELLRRRMFSWLLSYLTHSFSRPATDTHITHITRCWWRTKRSGCHATFTPEVRGKSTLIFYTFKAPDIRLSLVLVKCFLCKSFINYEHLLRLGLQKKAIQTSP